MTPLVGAAWLFGRTSADEVLTPERLTDEHRLIGRTAADFTAEEITPAIGALEQKDWTLARRLLARCGDLGLLGVDVPEEYGGVGLDKVSAVIVAEALGPAASFSATFGAQTNLAIVPLLWFGSDDQKRRYLPRLVSGEIVGAYALSESGSGSDALAARTRADRQPDGSWRLNGEKLWITNGGIADVFIVFAKVDAEKFSAFIVERGFPGVASGLEEHKMGLHGSSTTPLVLQDAAVPAGNLLGEIGRGHKIAFNVLNYGRFKLAAMCCGCAKTAIGEAARYAAGRRQFNMPIARFGAIRQKLADMAIDAFAVESMLYRTAGLIDAAQREAGRPPAETLEEFAVEAALLKVAGSEMLNAVLDENVQIHGGNGYVRDYPAERRYRDARVNRIFEGTNEINRLLVPTLVLKRTRSIDRDARDDRHDLYDGYGLKALARQLLGRASRTYGDALPGEQEVVLLVSDIIRDAFASESAALRAAAPGGATARADAAAVFAYDAGMRGYQRARVALAAMGAGDAIQALAPPSPLDTIAARRRVADAVLARGGYPF